VFTTEESVDLGGSIVVRKPEAPKSAVQPFSRDKLFASILRAVGHRTAPVEDAGALADTIIAKLLRSTHEAAVSPPEIIIITHETLSRFDRAAAVQYQAYHRS
jgi:transcriptional regulator NrdR family protein